MIYCNGSDAQVNTGMNEMKLRHCFNADGDEVIDIRAGDVIVILPPNEGEISLSIILLSGPVNGWFTYQEISNAAGHLPGEGE